MNDSQRARNRSRDRERKGQREREKESQREIQLESQRESHRELQLLSLALSGSLRLSLALSGSLWLSLAFLGSLQRLTNSGSSPWDNNPLLVATVADLCSANYPGKELLEKILVVSISTLAFFLTISSSFFPFLTSFTILR